MLRLAGDGRKRSHFELADSLNGFLGQPTLSHSVVYRLDEQYVNGIDHGYDEAGLDQSLDQEDPPLP